MGYKRIKHKVAILGSTGSIGSQCLDVIRRNPGICEVFALSAHSNADLLVQQCIEFRPQIAVIGDAAHAQTLSRILKEYNLKTEVWSKAADAARLAALPDYDTVVVGITGAAGLSPTYEGVCSGKRILLANKECLVMAGQFVMSAVATNGARVLPLDSEHNAIFQCLSSIERKRDRKKINPVDSIVLTASGGPFLRTPLAELATVSPEQAVAHPNWRMGKKISVDSATLMNKGFEAIEAHWLFSFAPNRIEVLIHPQSLIHAMVRLGDGSVLAQMAAPDMRIPIANALGWPEIIDSGVSTIDFAKYSRLDFIAVDEERFPSIKLAYEAMRQGKAAATVLNAANEVAVEAFLKNKLKFTDIFTLNRRMLEQYGDWAVGGIEDVFAIDHSIRVYAAELVSTI